MPLISVIIPAYNAEKTIQETIESVLNQTLPEFELIVINDGSQDSTLDIISNTKDSRLHIFSYPNSGSNTSRNRGFSHASGIYLSFLDADDLWTPDKLEAQFKALQEYPQASVAYSWTNYIDDCSQFLFPGRRITTTGDVYEDLLIANFLESGSNPLICRQALENVGGFDESLSAGQDWDLYLRLAVHYHFVCVPVAQILYRVSANSLSTNVIRQEEACLQVIDRAFTQAPESLQHLKKLSLANLYKYLTCKALQEPIDRQKTRVAARFLWNYVKNNPLRLQRTRFTLILLVKIAVILLLPTPHVQTSLLTIKSRLSQSG